MNWLYWGIPLIIAVFIVIILIYYYNKFVLKGNRIDNSLAQIDVQLKRRSDLIPNLIETVKGYAKHEKAIMEEVTNARKALMSAKDLPAKVKADTQLENALKTVFALAENYPQLKANENFIELQRELSSTEDKVAYSRQYYNDTILDFNNSIKVFPGKMFASLFGVKERPFIEITAEERKPVKVKFD
ncbi:MAG TPA: LemA family protein [Candidatus Paceibacterota bacterium]|nr:LemA family protein [Candidatus Paceibacterota bacterium]